MARAGHPSASGGAAHRLKPFDLVAILRIGGSQPIPNFQLARSTGWVTLPIAFITYSNWNAAPERIPRPTASNDNVFASAACGRPLKEEDHASHCIREACFARRKGTEMTPTTFLQTIYLGDRMCKSVEIDGYNREVKIKVDVISRVRGSAWNFYSEEDIVDGFLVFEGVTRFILDPPGPLPCDWIELVSSSFQPIDRSYKMTFSLGATASPNSIATEVRLELHATEVCLEDSAGQRIRS